MTNEQSGTDKSDNITKPSNYLDDLLNRNITNRNCSITVIKNEVKNKVRKVDW